MTDARYPADLDTAAPLLPGLVDDSSTLGSELLEPIEAQAARFSGKIVDKNRERVDGILGARAMGFPLRQICAAFHVSPHTVAEIERRHSVKLATLKDRLARKFGVFVELGLDRAIRQVDSMDIDKLMVSLGIAADKMQVLTGEPSAIIGTPEQARRYSIDHLRERLGRPVIDVTPSATGSEAAEEDQTRARDAAPAGSAVARLDASSKPAASDSSSDNKS